MLNGRRWWLPQYKHTTYEYTLQLLFHILTVREIQARLRRAVYIEENRTCATFVLPKGEEGRASVSICYLFLLSPCSPTRAPKWTRPGEGAGFEQPLLPDLVTKNSLASLASGKFFTVLPRAALSLALLFEHYCQSRMDVASWRIYHIIIVIGIY